MIKKRGQYNFSPDTNAFMDRKIVFLDRDGVINEFPGNGRYVTKVKDFHFIPRAKKAIHMLTDAGFEIFVVSNQAGVGKGIFTKQKLNQITKRMLSGIRSSGGKVRKVYYATRRRDENCDMRKPNIGAVRRAMKLLNKNIRSARGTFFVGDTEIDIKAGKNAGCKTIFVLSGREDCTYMRRWDDVEPDFIVKDLYEAAKLITGNGRANLIDRNSSYALRVTNRRRRKLGINLMRRSTD